MFKRVLLCYDGTEAGRRALRRGAELAILLGAHVSVLSIVTDGVGNAAVLAGAAGQACIVDEPAQYRKLLSESVEWLKARGVSADGHLASGDYLDQIIAYSPSTECRSHRSGPLSPPDRRLVVVWFQTGDVGRQGQMLHFRRGQRRG